MASWSLWIQYLFKGVGNDFNGGEVQTMLTAGNQGKAALVPSLGEGSGISGTP